MIRVIYNEADITDKISINTCYHDMFCEGQGDTLTIIFNDTERQWDTWQPKTGDTIDIVYGSIRTGRMYVDCMKAKNGLFEVTATALPLTYKIVKSKAWQKIGFINIAKEIANNHGLGFKSYGVADVLYQYLLQNNEKDFAFLNRVCVLEGCAFLIFDGELILYNQHYLEQTPPIKVIALTLDSDFSFIDNTAGLFGNCVIERGIYTAYFNAQNACDRLYKPKDEIVIKNEEEARRYAKNLLRRANKDTLKGYIYSQIMPELAASSTAELQSLIAPSYNGTVFITRIRNDYAKGTSKIFFRKPLDGY